MADSNTSLRKMTRAQLLKTLVEQSEAVGKIRSDKEALEIQLKENKETIAQLKVELKQKNDQIRNEKARLKVYAEKAKEKLQKKNEQVKVLKKALETERSIRMKSLLESKTISEASLYMDQLLEDTRRATAQYQKIVEMLAKEEKKHE